MNNIKCKVVFLNIERRVIPAFATHLLEHGTDLRYIQELLTLLDSKHLMGLGHQSSKTTKRYTHITNKGIKKIKSSLDELDINESEK